MNQLNEQDLIKQITAGDSAAYAVLVNRYQQMVYTAAIRVVGRSEDAEEVAQDVFLNAYRSLASFKGDCKFSTWLYRIAYNKSLDYLKSRKRQFAASSIEISERFDLEMPEEGTERIELREKREMIEAALSKLTASDALIITMFYLEEMTLKEIAEATGLKANAIKVRLHRSRKRLAASLQPILEPEKIKNYGS